MAPGDQAAEVPPRAGAAPEFSRSPAPAPRVDPTPLNLTKSGSRLGDRAYGIVLTALACTVLLALLLITWQLFVLSHPSLVKFGMRFFFQSGWDPTSDEFGAWPFVVGTLFTSIEALLIAMPLGLGTAIFLSEMAPKSLQRIVRFPIEMLAAIPSVVYGLWGLGQLAPLLRDHLEPALAATGLPFFAGPSLGVGVLCAGIVLGVMVLPTVVSLSLEVFSAVPRDQREAYFALGATRWEMIRRGLLPYSRPGIVGAGLLALGRALGETMAVAMVIGNSPDMLRSLLGTGATLASVIANEFTEAVSDVHRAALAELGLALLAASILLSALARLLLRAVGRSFTVRA
jgi:phosphate transport system permease protein